VTTVHVLAAGVMLAALIAYALLAGADFGGGIWDLVSRGPGAAEQRRAIARAIGPVWEANHVWLIFLIVLLFTCFPAAYAAASVALFWPLHLILLGITLRGASFVFRAYGTPHAAAQYAWSHVFGIASAVTPVLLGACLGAVSTGGIRWIDGTVGPGSGAAWFGRFPLATGVLALLLCAYLAAVYLAWESDGAVQAAFRRFALVTWIVAGVVSLAVLLLARTDAPRLWSALTSVPANLIVLAGTALAPASAGALLAWRFSVARVLAGAQVTLLLAGWGVAQFPYLIFPDLTVGNCAAPVATLTFTMMTLPLGAGLLAPSLLYLFSVFKGRNPTQEP
jgi:cytochrome bd ubiquinol oxidase subunit II